MRSPYGKWLGRAQGQLRESLSQRLSFFHRRQFLVIFAWLRQPDKLIPLLAALFSLVVAIQFIQAASYNWELANRYLRSKQQLSRLQLEVESLKLENQYYASSEYQELLARRKHNRVTPGEHIVFLPPNTFAPQSSQSAPASELPSPSNFIKWLIFLTGGRGLR